MAGNTIMDWKTISTTQAAFLRQALDVRRHALALGQLSQARQAGVTDEHIQRLEQAGSAAEKLMRRLDKGEFRIAVVGMEKAGKSTFVNAWLGCDLLPAKTERCTFTTTQIYSVSSDAEQRLETEPKTAKDFALYQENLREQCGSANPDAKTRAEQDLKVISEHEQTLYEVINEGTRSIRFTQLADIKTDLDKYVADQRYAHAMHEARLYTTELAAVDGVVFFDVPGLDSGLTKHVEETKTILSDCDAIVVIQRRDINLKAHEQDVVKYGETGDKYLALAEKLFVFWGQIDLKSSREVLETEWTKLLNEWAKFGIPEKRIVRGSAGAHLVLHGYPIPEIGDVDEVRRKMRLLTEIDNDAALKEATGIAELKARVQRYLDEERTVLLQRRVTAMMRDLYEPAEEIYRNVKRRYPEDPEKAMRGQQDRRNVLFSEWWGRRWDAMKQETNNRFTQRLNDFLSTNQQPDNKNALNRRYCDLVQETLKTLPSRQSDEIKKIFDGIAQPFDAREANYEWRGRLYKDTREAVKTISKQLAIELQKEAKELVADFRSQIWDSTEIEGYLIDAHYLDALERSLTTLFLRFARPVAELVVFGPLNSDRRDDIRRKIGPDIEIIDNYYSGDEPALRRVGRYANHGAGLLVNAELRKRILGDAGGVIKFVLKRHPLIAVLLNAGEAAFDVAASMTEKSASSASKKGAVIDEVEADMQVLEHYLINGIYEAAGLMQFAQQELEDLRDSFLAKKDTWGGVVRSEWEKGNPLLLRDMPLELQEQRFDTEVSDKLKQLGIALGQPVIKSSAQL
jgi:hypothetical protein